MNAKGHVFKYGDNVDTDVIIPARYLNSYDAKELATHAMVDIDPTFVERVQPGDLIVANKNFGCGSSREHAPLCLKTAGVSCVIAETFARIFYRNAINIGLPIIECPEAARNIEAGDEVEVDFGRYEKKKYTALGLEMWSFWLLPTIFKEPATVESIEHMKKRAHSFIDDLSKKNYQNVLISCHGGIMRVLCGILGHKKHELMWNPKPKNCEIREFTL